MQDTLLKSKSIALLIKFRQNSKSPKCGYGACSYSGCNGQAYEGNGNTCGNSGCGQHW